jgi:hypothetical protein
MSNTAFAEVEQEALRESAPKTFPTLHVLALPTRSPLFIDCLIEIYWVAAPAATMDRNNVASRSMHWVRNCGADPVDVH